jgi:hypothetical protein
MDTNFLDADLHRLTLLSQPRKGTKAQRKTSPQAEKSGKGRREKIKIKNAEQHKTFMGANRM